MCRLRNLWFLLAALGSIAASGCVTLYSTRPVELTVTQSGSAQPVANQPVILSYTHSKFVGAPPSVSETTDDQGRVVLPVGDVEFPIRLQVGQATFDVDREVVRTGGVLKPDGEQEGVELRVAPRSRTLLEWLFRYRFHKTCGIL
jgi:hypothetical protein